MQWPIVTEPRCYRIFLEPLNTFPPSINTNQFPADTQEKIQEKKVQRKKKTRDYFYKKEFTNEHIRKNQILQSSAMNYSLGVGQSFKNSKFLDIWKSVMQQKSDSQTKLKE